MRLILTYLLNSSHSVNYDNSLPTINEPLLKHTTFVLFNFLLDSEMESKDTVKMF